MSSYLTIAVPNTPEIVEVAKLVSKYCDPLTGGYDAYQSIATDADGNKFAVYGSVVSDEFAANVPYLQANPDALVAICNSDITNRWPDDAPFTLEQAKLFTDNARFSYVYGTIAGISDLGLIITQNTQAQTS